MDWLVSFARSFELIRLGSFSGRTPSLGLLEQVSRTSCGSIVGLAGRLSGWELFTVSRPARLLGRRVLLVLTLSLFLAVGIYGSYIFTAERSLHYLWSHLHRGYYFWGVVAGEFLSSGRKSRRLSSRVPALAHFAPLSHSFRSSGLRSHRFWEPTLC